MSARAMWDWPEIYIESTGKHASVAENLRVSLVSMVKTECELKYHAAVQGAVAAASLPTGTAGDGFHGGTSSALQSATAA